MPDISAFTLSGVVEVDERGFDRSMNRIDQRVRDARGRFVSFGDATKKLKGDFDTAGRGAEEFGRDLDAAGRKADHGKGAFSGLAGSLRNLYATVQNGSRSGGAGLGGSAFGSIGEALKMIPGLGMLAGGISSVTSAMASGVGVGFDYRRALEEGQIGFEVLLKSADKARAHLEELDRFSSQSPFDFPQLIESSQLVQAFGVEVQQVTRWLEVAGDASRGNVGSFNGILTALGQIKTKGKVSFEEMLQLVERGVPAWKYLADEIAKVDKNFAKLTDEQKIARAQKMVERGQVSSAGTVEAILRGMQGQFGGLGKRYANETANGLESQLRDVAGRQVGAATKGLFDGYKDTLRGGILLLGSETITGLSKRIGDGSGELIGAGVGAAKAFMGGFKSSEGMDSHSPSRKMEEEGKNAIKGFIDGLSAGTGLFELGQGSAARFMLGFTQALQSARFSDEIESLIEEAARETGVDPNLIRAVMRQESGGRRRAVSSAGAQGLMQLMPGTAQRYGVSDPFNARQNVMGGASYLRDLLAMFGGRTDLALAGYNSGENRREYRAAAREGRPINWSVMPAGVQRETRNYVSSVQGFYDQLSGASGGSQPAPAQRGFVRKIDEGMYFVTAGGEVFQLMNQWPSGTQGVGMPEQLRTRIGNVSDLAGLASQMGGMTNAEALARAFAERPLPVRVVNEGLRARDAAEHGGGDGGGTPNFDSLRARLASLMSGGEGASEISAAVGKLGDESELFLHNLKAVPGTLGEIAQAATAADGPIEGLVIGAKSLRERLRETAEAIPSLEDQLTDFVAGMPSQIGGIFGDAVREWDGSFDAFFDHVLEGFAGMLAQMSAQLAESAVTNLLTSLLTSVAGSAVGGWFKGVFGGGGGGNNLGLLGPGGGSGSGSTFGFFGPGSPSPIGGFRAEGGPVDAGTAYVVGERGPEIVMPRSAGTVVSNEQVRQALGGGQSSGGGGGREPITINFNVHGIRDTRGLKESMPQLARRMGRMIQAHWGD